MEPSVARVSAPNITPSAYMIPAIVVPVFLARGAGNPFSDKYALLSNDHRLFGVKLHVHIFDGNCVM